MKSSARRWIAITAGLLGLALLAFRFFPGGSSGGPEAGAVAGPVSSRSTRIAPAALAGGTRPVHAAENSADFRLALEAARQTDDPRVRSSEFGRILAEWIARDPAAALAYVRQLPAGPACTQGVFLVLEAIGRQDPERALTLARELVSTREQRAIYNALFARMAATDPAAAVSRLLLVPAGDSRDRALRALAEGWARIDLPAALTWARQLDPADRPPAMEAVLAILTPEDPLRAIDLAPQALMGAALDRILVAALQMLVRDDPGKAAVVVSRLAPGEAQTQAALVVARALADRDPGEALVWIRTLPADQVQGLALNNVLEVWGAKDPASAGQFVAQMNPGPAQEAAAAQLARLLAAANPANALAWAQSLTSDPARNLALITIASTWAQRDPVAAARWAGSVAAPELRTEALRGTLSYWMLQDSRAAQDFVFSLTGEAQARAAEFIAPGLAQQDPPAALAWAQALPTAEAREAALAAAYARWRGNAPAAARTWLAAANLPPEIKARLLGPPSN